MTILFAAGVHDTLTELFGLRKSATDLTLLQICLRAVVAFIAAIVIVRVAHKRFLSRRTAVDAVLAFMLASLLARTINGDERLFPSIAAGFVLVLLHRLVAWLSFRWHWFGTLVKGSENVVIENGKLREEVMRAHDLSRHDLLEDLRLKGIEDVSDVKEARLERSGALSVIRKSK